MENKFRYKIKRENKNIILNTILLNREICIFIYTFILIILYISTNSGIFLVLPLLFIYNISTTLFSVVYSIYSKIKQLLTVLFYSYLIIYCFMWFGFYFMSQTMNFDDVLDVSTVILFFIFVRVIKLQKIFVVLLLSVI